MSENTETVTLEELNALKATNERILAEHKADKVKWNKRFNEIEEEKQSTYKKKDDYKSLFETEAEKAKRLEGELSNVKYNAFQKNLELEVAKLAKDAHNPNQIIRSLSISETNTDLEGGTLTDLATQIDGLRKSEINLFKQEGVKQAGTIPRYMNSDNKEKTISEMTVAEAEKALLNSIQT